MNDSHFHITFTCTVYSLQFYYLHYNFCIVPSPPMNVYLAAIKGSPNQLTATWTPPLPKNGIITAYTVYCNTSANQEYPEQIIGKNIPIIRAVVNGTTQTVGFTTGLIPFTQYDCYVTANTSVGEGVPSQVVINRTSDSGRQGLLLECSTNYILLKLHDHGN